MSQTIEVPMANLKDYASNDSLQGSLEHILQPSSMDKTKERGMRRKKKKQESGHTLSPYLQKGTGSTQDQETLLMNTYLPHSSPDKLKSSNNEGSHNPAFIEDESTLQVITSGSEPKIITTSFTMPTTASISNTPDVIIKPVPKPRRSRSQSPANILEDMELVQENNNQLAIRTKKSRKKGSARKKSRDQSRDENLSNPGMDDELKSRNSSLSRESNDLSNVIKNTSEEITEEVGNTEELKSSLNKPRRMFGLFKSKSTKKSDAKLPEEQEVIEAEPASQTLVISDTQQPIREADKSSSLTAKIKNRLRSQRFKKQTQEPTINVSENRELVDSVVYDSSSVLGITIHGCDRLKINHYVTHPMVKVHLIDLSTQTYLKKSTADRPVTSHYEGGTVDYIIPVLTQPFNFKERKTVIPRWAETIELNEDYSYVVQKSADLIVFFELIDFVSMNATFSSEEAKLRDGWYHIAWAFMKVLGANEQLNLGKELRLQLFYPDGSVKSNKPGKPVVYKWWSSGRRKKYPSTLSVTIKEHRILEKVGSTRSMVPGQPEIGKFQDPESLSPERKESKELNLSRKVKWNRLPGQMCKIPNQRILTLRSGKGGCFTLKFSQGGRKLAAGCKDHESYPIFIYEIPGGELESTLTGHKGLIYDITWSINDKVLASTSADATCRIWSTDNPCTCLKLLPHPSYVYSALFHPTVQTVLVTSCYDHVVRVWSALGTQADGELIQELQGHTKHVNCICFNREGDTLFSADSVGDIFMWSCKVGKKDTKWMFSETLRLEEIKGLSINSIYLHPNGNRLFIQTKDNHIRLLDLKRRIFLQQFDGALNYQHYIRSCVTPCGTLLFSGSEDAQVYVWNVETGDRVNVYSQLPFILSVSHVQYHPHDHILAMTSFQDKMPILVFRYTAPPDQQTPKSQAQTVSPKEDPQSVLSPRAPITPISSRTNSSGRKVEILDTLDSVIKMANVSRAFAQGSSSYVTRNARSLLPPIPGRPGNSESSPSGSANYLPVPSPRRKVLDYSSDSYMDFKSGEG